MSTIRIVLVDDHDLVRAGLRALIQELDGIEVVGEANNGREGIRLVESLLPDVVLMDIMMPEMNGLDATARIVAKFPKVCVIILSMNTGEEHVLQSLRAGASGYLLKNISPTELEQAVQQVARGERHVSSAVTKHLISALAGGADKPLSLDRLSLRQREVLQLVAEGNTSKEIAKKIGVSVKTAESHRSDLMHVLNIHNTAGLVRYAIRTGVVNAHD